MVKYCSFLRDRERKRGIVEKRKDREAGCLCECELNSLEEKLTAG